MACGCSYTNVRNARLYPASLHPGQKCWPNYVADHLKLECVNIGRAGGSNDDIFNQVIKYISESNHKEVDIVCILWTQMFRVNLWNWARHTETINVFAQAKKSPNYEIAENLMNRVNKEMDKFIFNYFSNISIVSKLCDKLGIKLLMAQAIPFEPTVYDKDLCDTRYFFDRFIEYVIDTDINTQQFIGWPPILQLGGYALQDSNQPLHNEENRLSADDWHPNIEGHKIIADEYLKRYKEIYE